MMRRIALVPGIVAVVTVLAFNAGPAMAKTSPPPPSGASLVLSSASGGTTSLPAYGSSVALTATYAAMKTVPEVSLTCTSNGQQVYLNAQTGNGSVSPWTSSWTLSSQSWQAAGGGAASCVGELYYYTWQGRTETGVVYLASVTFNAG